ncbi:MAG TPA: efflux RND transporter periplasmic adaptor subunit [Candidatus Limnocylindrales bacterium]|nr:efflux RND transporter periplasmic adaptor subunit [Candidatus Limnocylindrales bacterium]
MRLKLLAIIGLLFVGGIAVFMTLGGLPSGAAAATTFLTSTAAVADVTDDVAATGAIASATSWALVFGAAPGSTAASQTGSPATWLVGEVKVKVGDRVTKGAVLATATNATLRAAVTTAANGVSTATIQLATAQDARDAATTTANIRRTRIDLLNARDGLAQAKANLADLKAQLARSSLVAPADGIVTAVNVTTGAEAPTADAIDLAAATFQVTANVVESDVATLQIGQAATVTVAAIDADLTGTVTAIAPVAEDSSSGGVVSYAATVALNAPPAALRPGMTADVTITTASASGVLAVPAAAIRGTSGNYNVLVLAAAAGAPESRPVDVGLMTSSLVEIKSGLNAGDVVVTGTSSQQRAGTTNANQGGGTFVVPGGGGGGFRGPGN